MRYRKPLRGRIWPLTSCLEAGGSQSPSSARSKLRSMVSASSEGPSPQAKPTPFVVRSSARTSSFSSSSTQMRPVSTRRKRSPSSLCSPGRAAKSKTRVGRSSSSSRATALKSYRSSTSDNLTLRSRLAVAVEDGIDLFVDAPLLADLLVPGQRLSILGHLLADGHALHVEDLVARRLHAASLALVVQLFPHLGHVVGVAVHRFLAAAHALHEPAHVGVALGERVAARSATRTTGAIRKGFRSASKPAGPRPGRAGHRAATPCRAARRSACRARASERRRPARSATAPRGSAPRQRSGRLRRRG